MLGLGILWSAWKKRRGFDPVLSKKLKGGARVVAYGLVVMTGLGVYSYKQAKAEIGKSSLQIGRDLAPVADLLDETHELKMNGETVFVASAVVREDFGKVLDRFEGHCKTNPGALGDAWKKLSEIGEAAKVEGSAKGVEAGGVIRHEAKLDGVIMCLVKGSKTPDTFSQAAHLFHETHDLGTLGRLRYAYARQNPETGKTLVLTVWTEDSFKLDNMFPKSGDAPGHDPPEMERPPEAARLLSVDVPNTPFGVYVYRSGMQPSAVTGFYDKKMEAAGWTVIDPPGDAQVNHGYMKDGVMFTLSTGRGDDGATIVSVGEMAADRRTSAAR
jgi:hypothetical protein